MCCSGGTEWFCLTLLPPHFAFLPRKVLPVCVFVFSGHCDLTKELGGMEELLIMCLTGFCAIALSCFHDNSFPGRKQRQEVSVGLRWHDAVLFFHLIGI